MANAVEATGPQGASRVAVDEFLEAIGPHWVPVRDAWETIRREQVGEEPSTLVVDTDFLVTFCRAHWTEQRGEGGVLSPGFWNLRKAVNVTSFQRDVLIAQSATLDRVLSSNVESARLKLDESDMRVAPSPVHDPRQRATYVCFYLARKLVEEAKSHALKKGDGLDFSHAVTGAAYGSFALLDKHWTRRLTEAIPDQRRIARLFNRSQLDGLLEEFDRDTRRLDALKATRRRY